MKVTDTEIYYINLKRVRQKYYNKEELRKISKGCREMESVAKKISKLSKEEEMQGIYLKEEQEAFIRDQIKAYAMKDGYNEGMEKGMEKGHAEGLKEGHKEGALNTQKEIAKNLLKEGIDIKIISTSTGLSKGEIEKLKSE